MSTVVFETSVKAWRIADGQILRGRGRGGEEQIPIISGTLLRVGVHEGESDDGEKYKQVECDLETVNGRESVKSAIGLAATASNVTPFMLLQGLLACNKGDVIAIKPERSKTAHEKYGTYTTFVNVGIVDTETLKAKAVKIPKEDFAGDSSKEKLVDALERLKFHSAYAPRPARDEDDSAPSAPSEFNLFCRDLEAKEWPLFGAIPAPYLEMAGKLGGEVYASAGDVPESVWSQMREGVAKAKSVPKAVAEAAKAAEEYDPFAD